MRDGRIEEILEVLLPPPDNVPSRGLHIGLLRPFPPLCSATGMEQVSLKWLSYVLLLLLDLIVCLFILLGLAKQARWLLILMTVLAWLALFLSWGSLGLETATVVALSDFCSEPNMFVLNSTQITTGTSSDVLDYYLTCSRSMNSPFQQ
ncbi:Protein tweety 1, partial [Ilyodon furcidens]